MYHLIIVPSFLFFGNIRKLYGNTEHTIHKEFRVDGLQDFPPLHKYLQKYVSKHIH